MKPNWQEGQVVRLVANPEEGWSEQLAKILEAPTCSEAPWTVELLPAFREDQFDDGLREVDEAQMAEVVQP